MLRDPANVGFWEAPSRQPTNWSMTAMSRNFEIHFKAFPRPDTGPRRGIGESGLKPAVRCKPHQVPVWAVLTPLPWFLPGPICIRGGLARHFASAWLFHRGIHLEATLASRENKVTQLQRVGRTKLALQVDS